MRFIYIFFLLLFVNLKKKKIDNMDVNRTFECMTCGKTFQQKFNLKRHLANIHDLEIKKEPGTSTE